MSMNKRPGFFSRLLAVLTGAGKHPLYDVEEKPSQSDEPKIASIGLPGTQWEFGCSASAATEIVVGYDRPAYRDTSEVTPVNDFLSKKADIGKDKKQASLDDYWDSYESASPDPYK